MAASTWLSAVQTMYVAYFGRPAAPTGREYYATVLDNASGNYAALLDDFWNSTESQGLFNQTSTEGKVNAIFNQLFGRDALLDGLTYWTNAINSGLVSLPQAAYTIAYNAAPADTAVLNAKLTAADAFTAALDTTDEVLAYINNASAGRTFLSGVASDAQATTAVANIDTTIASVVSGSDTNPGQTFMLTTGTDNITGTSGNDTVSAVYDRDGATVGTLNLSDAINGGAGTDTFSVRITDSNGNLLNGANFAAATVPTLTSIETLEVTPLVNATLALASIGNDLTTINVKSPNGTATFTGVNTNVKTFGLSDVVTDSADASFTFAAGLTGTADAVTLNVSGASSATKGAGDFAGVNFTGAAAADGLEIVNVVSSGSSANRLDALTQTTATTLKTVNVTGAAALRIDTALANTVKTINAADAAGGVNLGVAAGDNVTFTGGAGNDRINMAGGLTTDDVLNGGAGTNTLAISDATITATKTNAINKAIDAATNFQVLELTAAAPTDSSSISVAANGLTTIKTFAFTGGGTASLTASVAAGTAGNDAIQLTGFGSSNTNKIEIGATFQGATGAAGGSAGAGVVGGAGGDALQIGLGANSPADETTVTLKGFNLTGGAGGKGDTGTGGADGGAGGYGINAADFETINLVSTGSTATATNALAGGAGGAAGTSANAAGAAGAGILVNTNAVIKVTGANDLTFTTQTVNPTAGGVQVDALTFTGKLNVTGTAGNDIIKGGTGNDIIKGGAGRDTIDLSAGGQDTVVLTDVTAVANRDTISGFTAGSGGDKLDLSNLGTSVDTVKAYTGTGVAFTLATTDNVVLFNFAGTNNSANLAGATDGTELFKAIANQGSTITSLTATNADTGYIAAYDGTNAYLYYYAETGGDAAVGAAEIHLIGTLNNVATGTLVAANFV